MGDWELDTRVTGGSGRYRSHLSEQWAVWGPNGGYRAAIALRAIGAEARLRRPASFSCLFLGTGHFGPIDLEVTPLVRGRRAEAWRCVATQEGKPLLETNAWCVEPELEGFEHSDLAPPGVPGPSALRGYQEHADNYADWYPIWRRIEGRPVVWSQEAQPPVWHTWLRLRETPRLDDDPFLEASRSVLWMDTLPWNALIAPHPWPRPYLAPNLDLCIQFHRLAPDADWILCDGICPVAREGLGGSSGRLWTADGRLIASGVSHLLCRPNPAYADELDRAKLLGRC